jgi:hypothetical protein
LWSKLPCIESIVFIRLKLNICSPRRKDPKTKEQDKEYKKQMKDFEKAFRKEGRSKILFENKKFLIFFLEFVKDQMMRKMESSAHEASQLED